MVAGSQGTKQCFFIVKSDVGQDPRSADYLEVVFNDNPSVGCSGTGWVFKKNAVAYVNSTNIEETGNSVIWQVEDGVTNSGTGPLDVVTLEYTPGTCGLEGSAEPECQLGAISIFTVLNRVWGPTITRVGDLADDIVQVFFQEGGAPAVAGDKWQVEVNSVPRVITNVAIDTVRVQLTLDSPVVQGDTVTVTHAPAFDWIGACQSTDGRYCWRFYDMPVNNVVGLAFWKNQDDGPWLIDARDGRWRLQ